MGKKYLLTILLLILTACSMKTYTITFNTNGGGSGLTGSANVEWIKIYAGEADSMWTPNEADLYFVTNYHGFIEDDDIANIFEGHVEANQFYEI